MEIQPPLRRIHGDHLFRTGRYRLSLEYWRKQPTGKIVESLRPQRGKLNYVEFLKVRDDGLIFQGNTRIKVLEERGYNVEALPRYPYF